jgi:hypothetical protein
LRRVRIDSVVERLVIAEARHYRELCAKFILKSVSLDLQCRLQHHLWFPESKATFDSASLTPAVAAPVLLIAHVIETLNAGRIDDAMVARRSTSAKTSRHGRIDGER